MARQTERRSNLLTALASGRFGNSSRVEFEVRSIGRYRARTRCAHCPRVAVSLGGPLLRARTWAGELCRRRLLPPDSTLLPLAALLRLGESPPQFDVPDAQRRW